MRSKLASVLNCKCNEEYVVAILGKEFGFSHEALTPEGICEMEGSEE